MKYFIPFICGMSVIAAFLFMQSIGERIGDLEKDSENLHKRISELVERVDELEWK